MRSKYVITALSFVALLLLFFSFGRAAFAQGPLGENGQGPDGQVHAILAGTIDGITVADPGDDFSGGTITVDGQIVIIPRNLVIDLPANRLTLKQLVDGDALGGSLVGRASVSILANRTPGGNLIAGEVFIEKGAPENVAGKVTYIDYDFGYFRVNGTPGVDSGGTMVRMNDPDTRHSIQTGGPGCGLGPNCSPDPRFTNDPDNYTFVFSTGYPLCIPSTVTRVFTDVLDLDADSVTAETLTTPVVSGSGSFEDLLCPTANHLTGGVGNEASDSRLFAPLQLGDWVDAEGNLETIAGTTFLSAHTILVGSAITTRDEPDQPDYMIFDEVEWDVAGFQNIRTRVLLIGFTTLPTVDTDVFALHIDPATGTENEYILASTLGCDVIGGGVVGGVGLCKAQGIPPNSFGIFRIRYDVDFFEAAINPPGEPVKPKLSPCQHLNNANLAAIGHTSPCSASPTITEEFAVVSPVSRDLIGRTRHKALGDPLLLITLDIDGDEVQNGEYLNPVGIGHPEFGEIDLNRIATPLIFAGEPWLLDRRLGPGGWDTVGSPQPLCPFPYSGLDPRRQADTTDPLVGLVGLPPGSENDIFAFHPFGPTDLLGWPPPPNDPSFDSFIADPTAIDYSVVCPGGVAPNSPPVADDDTATTDDATPVAIDVLANDTDVDGAVDATTVAITTLPLSGTLAIDPLTGVTTYTPTVSGPYVDIFNYTVEDNEAALSNVAAVTVTVVAAGSNLAPVAVDDSATTTGVGPVLIDVLGNDTDADGTLDPTTVVAGPPTSGSVSVNPTTGEITFTPAPSTANSPVAEGPINPDNGFPVWYEDSSAGIAPTSSFTYTVNDDLGAVSNEATVTVTANGLVLQLCVDIGLTGPCIFDGDPALGETPLDPDLPPFVADLEADSNFAGEAFWWLADALIGGRTGVGQTPARLTLAQEATFLDPLGVADLVQNGHQAYFGRTRIRVDGLTAGATYTVTHPYGVQTFVAADNGTGVGEINDTVDMGVDPGTSVFDSFAGPYLTWDDAAPAPPAGFIGDPNVLHTVTGSPTGDNVFRIEGPDVGGPGVDLIETDLFAVLGKIAIAVAVSDAATTDDATPVTVDVVANDDDATYPSVTIDPTSVAIVTPPTSGTATANLDGTITYTPTVAGSYVDTLIYTVNDSLGNTSNLAFVTITVTASGADLSIGGADSPDPVVAGETLTYVVTVSNAGPDTALSVDMTDTLPAGVIFVSATPTQGGPCGEAGGVVTCGLLDITSGSSVDVTIVVTAPTVTGLITNIASVTSPTTDPAPGNNSYSGDTDVVVAPPPPNTAPSVSIDTPSDGDSFFTTDTISFSGTASDLEDAGLSAADIEWSSDLDGSLGSGSPVLTSLSAGTHTITAEVTDSGGLPASDSIVITVVTPDSITIDRAEFRAGKNEWRIQGTGSVPGNIVTLSTDGDIIGTAVVDALGDWRFRERNSPTPVGGSETVDASSNGGGTFSGFTVTVK